MGFAPHRIEECAKGSRILRWRSIAGDARLCRCARRYGNRLSGGLDWHCCCIAARDRTFQEKGEVYRSFLEERRNQLVVCGQTFPLRGKGRLVRRGTPRVPVATRLVVHGRRWLHCSLVCGVRHYPSVRPGYPSVDWKGKG